jgi:pimeloyl-ACP methyl ester carboxylesterase
MTMFLDLRAIPSGGFVAHDVTVRDTSTGAAMALDEFERRTRGRKLVLATHGFNVNSEEGLSELGKWDALCALPEPWAYVGVLWPGDSTFLPLLDYPLEGLVALHSGRLLARFLNDHAAGAASISLVSHSLGARMVLETIQNLKRRVAVLILMAGAIEDDCLSNEYAQAMKQVAQVHVLASRSDWVLKAAFPLGNLVGEILMHGHPYFRAALGLQGPHSVAEIEALYQLWQIPDDWDYAHGDYLPGQQVEPRMAPPLPVPASDAPLPRATVHWKPCWSAGVIASQFER